MVANDTPGDGDFHSGRPACRTKSDEGGVAKPRDARHHEEAVRPTIPANPLTASLPFQTRAADQIDWPEESDRWAGEDRGLGNGNLTLAGPSTVIHGFSGVEGNTRLSYFSNMAHLERGRLAVSIQRPKWMVPPAKQGRLACREVSISFASGIACWPARPQPLPEGDDIQEEWLDEERLPPDRNLPSRSEPDMLLVPGGVFERGNDRGAADQRPAHPVYLPPFEISATEVTNHLYRFFIEATGHRAPEGPRYGWKGRTYPSRQANSPVVLISWNDAAAFCHWLSRETGRTYRLPTEAEWEKAAQVIGDRYQSVGSIWEWCQDWYDREAYRNAARISPQGPPKGKRVRGMGIEGPARVIRGGGFGRASLSRRVTERNFFSPDQGRFDLGFRVVREEVPAPPPWSVRPNRNPLH